MQWVLMRRSRIQYPKPREFGAGELRSAAAAMSVGSYGGEVGCSDITRSWPSRHRQQETAACQNVTQGCGVWSRSAFGVIRQSVCLRTSACCDQYVNSKDVECRGSCTDNYSKPQFSDTGLRARHAEFAQSKVSIRPLWYSGYSRDRCDQSGMLC